MKSMYMKSKEAIGWLGIVMMISMEKMTKMTFKGRRTMLSSKAAQKLNDIKRKSAHHRL